MKKFFVILGVVLAITGCGKDIEKKEEVVKVEKNIPSVEKEIITFKREDNKEIITLESSNLFETGILTIGNKKIEMKEAVSGSGTRMIGENEKSELVVLQHTQNNQEFIVDSNVGVVTEAYVNPFNDIVSAKNTVTVQSSMKAYGNEIKIIPNPFQSSFKVKIPENVLVKEMNLFNTNGKLVAQNLSNPYVSAQLSSGVYFLEIKTFDKTYHKKVIKN